MGWRDGPIFKTIERLAMDLNSVPGTHSEHHLELQLQGT